MFQGCPDQASCFLSAGHLLGPIFYQYEVRDGKWKTAVDQNSTFSNFKTRQNNSSIQDSMKIICNALHDRNTGFIKRLHQHNNKVQVSLQVFFVIHQLPSPAHWTREGHKSLLFKLDITHDVKFIFIMYSTTGKEAVTEHSCWNFRLRKK